MADIEEKTGWVESLDGTVLFYRTFDAGGRRLRVVISHGLGEHSGRYGHVVDTLISLGASVWIHDHRGHGRSQGRRGHVNDFGDYVRDLKTLIEMAGKNRQDRLPLLLLGHSMGGLIALSLARQDPGCIDGLIVSSPLLGIPKPLPTAAVTAVRILSKVWPTFTLNNKIDPSTISHDTAEVDAYTHSEWVHGKISARWFVRCISEIEATGGSPAAIRTPILMQIAGDDHLVSAPAALAFFNGLAESDKTLCHYGRLYHEIYNETLPERRKVLDDLKKWISDRYL